MESAIRAAFLEWLANQPFDPKFAPAVRWRENRRENLLVLRLTYDLVKDPFGSAVWEPVRRVCEFLESRRYRLQRLHDFSDARRPRVGLLFDFS